MKIRAIVIGKPPSQRSLPGFDRTWTVAMGDRKADIRPDKSSAVIKGILNAAERLEWVELLRERADDLEEANVRPADYKNQDPRTLRNSLRQKEAEHKSQAERRLQSFAESVIGRSTVFCLSDPRDESCSQLTAIIATELAAYSAEELIGLESTITFAPLEDSRTCHKPMAAFVAQSIDACTSVDLSDFDVRRKGPVLLVGPTGAGKTELARHLHHRWGFRVDGFVKVNVAAVSKDLIESRLRGHERGVFTGANEARSGWFEQAHEGTLFLDEFQNAPEAVQLQLLDLLSAVSDDVQIARMGKDAKPATFQVRVILAANEPLEKLLSENRLRPDLFNRVRIVKQIRSLAARLAEPAPGEPSPETLLRRLLAIYRWKSNRAALLSVEGRPDEREDAARIEHLFPQVTGEVLNALMAHSWPGNLRELERISFDLYWHLETRSGPDLEFVREQIHRLGLPPPSVASAEGPLLPSHEIARLQQIEKILLRHQLDIDAAGPELAAIRRKTPHLLREYLRKNERLLSEEFRNHRRAPLLLEPRTRKRREMKTALPVSV